MMKLKSCLQFSFFFLYLRERHGAGFVSILFLVFKEKGFYDISLNFFILHLYWRILKHNLVVAGSLCQEILRESSPKLHYIRC